MGSVDADQHEIAVFDHVKAVHPHESRWRRFARLIAGVRCREGTEVAHADKRERPLLHPRHVDRFLHPPDVGLGERRPAPGDLIEVAARHRVVTRVKSMGDLSGGEDIDIGGQFVVQPSTERPGGQARADVEVRDLGERMDARIGAARPIQLEVLAAGHRTDGAIDLTLNRPGVLLNLPAAVPRAGVLDRQLEARHWAILRAGRGRRGRRGSPATPRAVHASGRSPPRAGQGRGRLTSRRS